MNRQTGTVDGRCGLEAVFTAFNTCEPAGWTVFLCRDEEENYSLRFSYEMNETDSVWNHTISDVTVTHAQEGNGYHINSTVRDSVTASEPIHVVSRSLHALAIVEEEIEFNRDVERILHWHLSGENDLPCEHTWKQSPLQTIAGLTDADIERLAREYGTYERLSRDEPEAFDDLVPECASAVEIHQIASEAVENFRTVGHLGECSSTNSETVEANEDTVLPEP